MTTGQEEVRLRDELLALIEEADYDGLGLALVEVHPSDIADLLESVEDDEKRGRILRLLPAELASEAVAEMEEGEERTNLLSALAPFETAGLLQELADDDAADLIAELEPGDRARILAALPLAEAGELAGLLRYEEDTAGGLMTTSLVSIQARLTADEAIGQVRIQGREVEDFYTVFVVDGRHRLLGTVPLDDLILADPEARVEALVEPVVAAVTPDVDQEEVGRLLSRYNLVSLPVVTGEGELLGRITFDDVIDVIEAERTEDLFRLAGVPDEEEIRGDWQAAVRSRLPWLTANLATAGIAASVVAFFTGLIEQFAYLAVVMPIVAGMGGNAGTQALAVTVRRLAISGGPLERRTQVVGKELIVGLVNGAAIGFVVALGAGWVWGWEFGGVVLLAMWGNIVVAGFAGAFVPTLLDRFGIDPAVASSVFVTTFTDLFGFFLLLGLASAVLLP